MFSGCHSAAPARDQGFSRAGFETGTHRSHCFGDMELAGLDLQHGRHPNRATREERFIPD